MADANALKDQGNKAFAAKQYDDAIDLFTKAIALDPSNHVLFSNRSAANAGKRLYDDALEDAETCIKVNPKWSKGYARKGAALHGAHRWDDAIAAYEEGIQLEDSPALRKGLKEVQEAKEHGQSSGGGEMGLGKMFADPNMIGKLASSPKTAKYLADPGFLSSLQAIQKNPQLAQSALQDPRMIECMGVLMGIDINAFGRDEGAPPGMASSPPTSPPPKASTSSPPPKPATPTSAPKPSASSSRVQDEMEVDEEENDPGRAEEKRLQAEAEGLKKAGGDAYKKRDFHAAIAAYEKAWDVWPKDITFLTNLGACYFEQGDYDKCIETCDMAIEEGRSIRADYKLVAKAYGRTGSAYWKKGDLASAVKAFQKSLSEHRTPDILNKLRDVEREKKAADVAAYVDPELSAKAREEGNALFKAADFVGAVKSYTESIKRDPQDPRGYNNRALCYTKLAALPEALKDAEEAIKVDPTFIKAYIRKSTVLLAMREHTKSIEAIQEAEMKDVDGKNASEIQQQMYKCQQAISSARSNETDEETLQRATRDPEIAQIMNDPVMQQILQQAQSNPGALQDHMKNPIVRDKIMKLVNAGIIKTR